MSSTGWASISIFDATHDAHQAKFMVIFATLMRIVKNIMTNCARIKFAWFNQEHFIIVTI
jgi:hypothetical protein